MVRYASIEEQVDKDFERACRRAFLRRVIARLRNEGGSGRLFSFEEARKSLGAYGKVYLGMRVVPVEKIVGSVGRHRDFDRSFLPVRASAGERWKRVDRAFYRAVDLSPVSLYRIGDTYFVQDGNNRVCVARHQGVEMIDAEVVELRARKLAVSKPTSQAGTPEERRENDGRPAAA
jgi:hypothetical protein